MEEKRKRGRPKGVHHNKQKPTDPVPTDLAPGSKAKIEYMRWRVANGFALFHPKDKRL